MTPLAVGILYNQWAHSVLSFKFPNPIAMFRGMLIGLLGIYLQLTGLFALSSVVFCLGPAGRKSVP